MVAAAVNMRAIGEENTGYRYFQQREIRRALTDYIAKISAAANRKMKK